MGGTYRLRQLLGRGAMGAVYEALDERTAALVAVKLVRPELLTDAGLVRRFRREAHSVSSLDHPNLVRIHDVAPAAGDEAAPFLVMERLAGRTLAQLLRQEGPLPLDRVTDIVTQALDAIGYAHKRGVLHRDLKPSNIMLVGGAAGGSCHDLVKVCDFGLAKLIGGEDGRAASDTLNSSGFAALCGTPEYMSPEQARTEPLDGRADIYSMGVILYQMVTGTIPFRARSAMGVLSRHLTQPPEPPSQRCPHRDIPQPLEDLILRALAKERESRPATAEVFASELRALRDLGWTNLPVAERPDTESPSTLATERPRRSTSFARLSPRRPAAVAWVFAGMATVVASTVLLIREKDRASPDHKRSEYPSASPSAAIPIEAPVPIQRFPDTTYVAPPPASSGAVVRGRPSHRRLVAPLPRPNPSVPAPPSAEIAAVDAPAAFPDFVARAEELLSEGHAAEACKTLEHSTPTAGEAARFHRAFGKCLMRQGRSSEAKVHYSRYLELSPDAPDATYLREILD